MAKTITDINCIKIYLKGAMGRSGHHAKEVREIVLALIGAVIWRKNNKPIEVRVHSGKTTNVLWWYSKRNIRYAFSYNHKKQIELRKNNLRGEVVAAFDNKSKIADIINLFKKL